MIILPPFCCAICHTYFRSKREQHSKNKNRKEQTDMERIVFLITNEEKQALKIKAIKEKKTLSQFLREVIKAQTEEETTQTQEQTTKARIQEINDILQKQGSTMTREQREQLKAEREALKERGGSV